jgi:hypothetical protein
MPVTYPDRNRATTPVTLRVGSTTWSVTAVIDTGAEQSVINVAKIPNLSVAEQDANRGKRIQATMVFAVEEGGTEKLVRCRLPVYMGDQDVLGQDQRMMLGIQFSHRPLPAGLGLGGGGHLRSGKGGRPVSDSDPGGVVYYKDDNRPYTRVQLTDASGHVVGADEALVDSAADESVIGPDLQAKLPKDVKRRKVKGRVGANSGVTDVERIDDYSMEFDTDSGKRVKCKLPVALGPRTILGNDQLSTYGVALIDDPAHGYGRLYIVAWEPEVASALRALPADVRMAYARRDVEWALNSGLAASSLVPHGAVSRNRRSL